MSIWDGCFSYNMSCELPGSIYFQGFTFESYSLSHDSWQNTFSHSVGIPLTPMMIPFLYRNTLALWGQMPVLSESCSKKSFLMPMSSSIFPIFSSIRASESAFMSRYYIYLELSFVQSEKLRLGFTLQQVAIKFNKKCLLKMLSFRQCILLSSLSKIWWFLGVWISMWVPSFIPMVNVSDFVPAPCCFYSNSSVVCLKSGVVIHLSVVLFIIILATLGPFYFHMKFNIFSSL